MVQVENRVAGAYSMPFIGGSYPSPPYLYRRDEEVIVPFDTDPDAARSLLPPGLELKEPARGIMRMVRHGHSPFGVYQGAYLGLRTHWQGETLIYMLFGLVDNEPSMLCGREIWGIPKKLGKISLEWHGEALYGRAERPVGSPVSELTIQITMPRQIGPEFSRGPAGVFLRRIPSPERDGAPLVQLIKTDEAEGAELEGTESPLVFDAEASLKLSSTSNADPWGLLPVLNVRRAMYIRGGLKVLGFGRILHDFSEQR